MNREDDQQYTLAEFCQITRLNEGTVRELVTVGVIEPHVRRSYWYFSGNEVRQCAKAERLMRDLELTPHGAALALELLDQNRGLRSRVTYLERLLARLSG